ncbi:RluA family pseudouridine synthase [Levilactobacillus bambusae]|uniref:RNA pseudouridylate synthase n=1 Tax=Levilactobacillus bambusae TaxID=2024736 RepID=A0A2V1MXR6_9LACO|nr:RluA family pseudouridine synthase [Levilactobacillus bambusae]PWF99840.1 RluA family pseudouridine synthase [Levilactobacillus bambusae]
MSPQWQVNRQLSPTQPTVSLRNLLQKQWQLPKRLVGDLRQHRRVTLNGTYQPVNTLVHPGDQLQMTFVPNDFGHPYADVRPDSAQTVAVLYETADLVVVNKTQGSKTHPNLPWETGTTQNHVAAYLGPNADGPYILSRLDQETTGVLLFAKSPVVVPILEREIANKRVQRTYLAWVHGTTPPEGTFTDPIGLDPTDKRKRQINGVNPQTAITHYRTLDRHHNRSLVALRLETGRTHQLRVHLAGNGYPIVGDPLYAHDKPTTRLRLHCRQLIIPLPFSTERVTVIAPVPRHFNAV